MAVGENTVVNVVVNQPGEQNPVPANIVEDGLYRSIQLDQLTTITNIHLAVNAPMVSNTQRNYAISIRLNNIQATEVRVFLFMSSTK